VRINPSNSRSSESKSSSSTSEKFVVQDADSLQGQRLKVTDDDAIKELTSFYSSIDKVTVEIRHYFWVTQFVLITISLTVIYLTSFVPAQYSPTFPFSETVYNKFVFVAFVAGCFSDNNNYWQNAGPFYVVLVIMVCEKLAQAWILDKFGCDK
jgi:hypothetical protein